MLIAHRNWMATSVTLYRWIRMHISKVKANAGQVQLSEIKMLDNGGGVYAWPEGTTCYNTTSHSNSGTFGTGQTPDKLIDGNTSTKMCAINLGSTNYFGFDIYIDIGECVFDAHKWCKWCWYTADDNPGRDPVTFSLYLSTDAETWIPVDSCADVSITTTRFALAYTGDINLNMEYVKTGLVAMWDGEWNAGGGVHDANVGAVNIAGDAELVFPTNLDYWSMGAKSFDLSLIYHTDVRGRITISANTFSMSQFTTEVCLSRGSDSTGEFGLVQDGVSFLTELNGASTALFRAYDSGGGLTINAQPNVGSTTVPNTLAFTYDGTTARFYANGTLSTSAAMVLRAAFNVGLVRIGSVYLYNSGSIFSIRVYNKALTAQNVADNAELDQARFNLP